MKRILIICSRRTNRAPRLNNTYNLLNSKYDITIAGDSQPTYISRRKFIELKTQKTSFSKLHRGLVLFLFMPLFPFKLSHLKYILKPNAFNLYKTLSFRKLDIVILHHIDLLPIICYLKRKEKFKLILNIHEYYPKEFDHQKNWLKMQTYWDNLCNEFMSHVDLFLSVNETISNEYLKQFKLDKSKFFIYPNVKKFEDLKPINSLKKQIRLVHHGAAIPSRNIENMIKLMDFLPQNYELTLILVERNPEYLKYLKSFESQRIRFLKPINFDKIPEHLNCYDIGIYFLEPSNFNEENSLPNKFFEFIQARLCIAVTPVNEMKKIVLENEIGIVSKDYDLNKFAEQLSKLSKKEIFRYKNNVHKVAFEYSSNFYEKRILNEFEKLI